MKKKQSIVILVICAVLTVLLGFTAIKGWGPTGTGSMANIRTGLDLSGGVSITYQTKTENPSQEDMDDTIYKLQQRVFQYSNEAQVYQQGSNRINIEIRGRTTPTRFWKSWANRVRWYSRMRAVIQSLRERISQTRRVWREQILRPDSGNIW